MIVNNEWEEAMKVTVVACFMVFRHLFEGIVENRENS
jgi:hypothetical protein